MNILVTPEWAEKRRDDPQLLLLDVRLKPGNDDLMAAGARHFDLRNKFRDVTNALPNTFPSPEQFTVAAAELGINENSVVVLIDNVGVYSSPRAWFLLRAMGHQEVYILDGGLPEWQTAGLPTVAFTKNHGAEPGNFRARPSGAVVTQGAEVLAGGAFTVVDARSRGRYDGTEPEPRAGLPSGHLPGSVSLPFAEVLNGTKFKTRRELSPIFKERNLEGGTLVFSCGSGVTACILLVAASLVLSQPLKVYDGSWTEYCGLGGAIETNLA